MSEVKVERRHRERAATLIPFVASAWVEDPAHVYGLATPELSLLGKAAQAFADFEHSARESAQGEGAWADALLNTWVSAVAGRAVHIDTSATAPAIDVVLFTERSVRREYAGATVETARIAAAYALYTKDPTLPPPPKAEGK